MPRSQIHPATYNLTEAQTMRSMSFSLTEPQLRDGTKDVTRRQGWKNLKPGDRFRAVQKAMGLKKGEKQVVICALECVSNDAVRLDTITKRDVVREGFPDMTPRQFVKMFCESHKGCKPGDEVQRIVFKRVT
jgi:hypothetical protein